MEEITVAVVHAGSEKELNLLRDFAPRMTRHLNAQGGLFGSPISLEVMPVKDRSAPVALELAAELNRREDLLVVLFWGGNWLGKPASDVVQSFLQATRDQPFIVLSGTTHPEHHIHPGSFALSPFQRDKQALLHRFITDLPQGLSVGYVGKTIPELPALRTAAAESGRELGEILLPDSANTQDPSAEDYASLVQELETRPPAQCWVLGASALNRPIRAWLRERFPQAVIVSMNSGKKLDWFTGDSNVGDLFFGQEGNRERLDIPYTNLFQLSDDFPRLKLDAMLLLRQAALSANLDGKTLPRTDLFAALRRGLLDIDGKKGVFVGTRHALWFEPKTRVSLSGNVCLKRRLNVETEGLLYAKQYVRTPNGELQPLPVLYLNIDILSVDSVSIEDKTFRAKFYLDMRSLTEISLADVRLLNLAGKQGDYELLMQGLDMEENEMVGVKRYLVADTFTFTPKMASYPFDTQLVDVEVAPANPMEKNILIQPAPREKQDREFDAPGWKIAGAELSSHTSFWSVPVDQSFNTAYRSFSAVSFGWLLQRASKDTILRVAVPMTVLLTITFFTVFAKPDDASSKVGELTQTMLAVIALYFATTKPNTEEMTILDLVFRVAYVLIGGLLGTILLVSTFYPEAYSRFMQFWMLLFPTILIHQAWQAKRIYAGDMQGVTSRKPTQPREWRIVRWIRAKIGV